MILIGLASYLVIGLLFSGALAGASIKNGKITMSGGSFFIAVFLWPVVTLLALGYRISLLLNKKGKCCGKKACCKET
jgi:hypothetical protein